MLIKRGPSLCDLCSSPPCLIPGPSTEHHILNSAWKDMLNYTQEKEIRREKGQETGAGMGEETRIVHPGRKAIMVSKYVHWQKGADCAEERASVWCGERFRKVLLGLPMKKCSNL